MLSWIVAASLILLGPEVPVQRPSEPVALALDWQAAPECPSRDALLERVRALLPTLPEQVPSAGTAGLRVTARVAPQVDASWQVELELVTPDGVGTRRFAAGSCEEAARATVLVVAIALDPVGAATRLSASTPASAPVSVPAPTPTPAPAADAREPSEPAIRSRIGESSNLVLDSSEPARARAPRVGLALHGGAGWGPTRALHGAFGGSLALFDRRWRAELAADWSTPRVQRFADGRGASFDAWAIGMRGCFVPTRRTLEFPLCGGLEVGRVRGRGIAPTSNIEQRGVVWLAPLLGPGLRWSPIERLALGLDVVLLVPLTRASFVIGEQELQRIPALGARMLVGIELRLP